MHKRKLSWCPAELLSKLRTAIRALGSSWQSCIGDSHTTSGRRGVFLKALKALGFREHDHSGAGAAQFRSRKHKLILKLGFFCYQKIPIKAIPTLVMRRGSEGEKLVLQPLACTRQKNDALYAIEYAKYALSSYRHRVLYFGHDTHCNNVAHYNGEPVVIDW